MGKGSTSSTVRVEDSQRELCYAAGPSLGLIAPDDYTYHLAVHMVEGHRLATCSRSRLEICPPYLGRAEGLVSHRPCPGSTRSKNRKRLKAKSQLVEAADNAMVVDNNSHVDVVNQSIVARVTLHVLRLVYI